MKEITRRLRQLRAGRPITQRDLALKADLPITRYWEIENGYREPSGDELAAIAKVLRCEPADISTAHQEVA
jgi:transcriptional regulator with XRE-family HTH domain